MAITNSDLEKRQGIYMIRQRSSGMYYVGKSVNVKQRIGRHIKEGKPGIGEAIREFGVDDFDLEVEYFPNFSSTELQDLEYECIKRFRSLKPNGFNEKCRGASNVVTQETRAKMSDAWKDRKPHSAEHKAKISASMKGRKHSPETRQKMSESGKNKSPETLHKLSIANKGKKQSLEHRQKISAAGKARYERLRNYK